MRRSLRRIIGFAVLAVVAVVAIGFRPVLGATTLTVALTAAGLAIRTAVERARRFDLHAARARALIGRRDRWLRLDPAR